MKKLSAQCMINGYSSYISSTVWLIGAICLALLLGGCFSRIIMMTPSEELLENPAPLPLTVRVELEELEEVTPHSVTPIIMDRGSVVHTIKTYLLKRRTFREVVEEGPSDSTLTLNLTYDVVDFGGFYYVLNLKARLTLKDGQVVGFYTGTAKEPGGFSRFTAKADQTFLNKALHASFKDLAKQIEDSRHTILMALVKPPQQEVAKKPVPAPTSSEEELRQATTSDVDELPAVKRRAKGNAYAIVIGIEQYREKLPKADFAKHDAEVVAEYLTKVMGYQEEDVVTLINERALKSDLEKYIEKWLPNNVEKDGSVFIYYSGHGAPNPKTGDAYLVPFDGDPTFIEQTGYPLKRLYESLGKLNTKEIVVMLDSCFSGAGGRSVIAKGARPMVITTEGNMILNQKMAVISAAGGEEISSTYDEKGHGLFTYFMLKGLKGEADTDANGKIEIQELYNYIKPQVERIARRIYNNEQTPQLVAPPERQRMTLIEGAR